MKPVVIIVKEKDGKLDITKEELDKIIESAYQNGYDDGLKETFKAYDKGYDDAKKEEEMKKIVPSQPYMPPQIPIDPTIPPYIITCDSAGNTNTLTNTPNENTQKDLYIDCGDNYLSGGNK